MRFPWSAPRPTWHYVFRSGVERDYPIAEDGLRPVTLREAQERPWDLETVELRLGDNCLAYATLREPRRVGICSGPVFDVPEGAVLYHAICRVKVVNAGRPRATPSLDAGTGFVLGWRTANLQRRMEVFIDDRRQRIDVEPGPVEPLASAWIESGV